VHYDDDMQPHYDDDMQPGFSDGMQPEFDEMNTTQDERVDDQAMDFLSTGCVDQLILEISVYYIFGCSLNYFFSGGILNSNTKTSLDTNYSIISSPVILYADAGRIITMLRYFDDANIFNLVVGYSDIIDTVRSCWRHCRLLKMDIIFTVSHHLKLAVGSHEIQLNPDDFCFILNQIDLDVGRTNLHFAATNARPLRRIAFQIEMGMTVEIELMLAAQTTLPKDVMDNSNVSILQWCTSILGITITALLLETHQGMSHDPRNTNMAHICVIVITVRSGTFRTTRLNAWYRRFYFCNFDFRTLVSAERVHCDPDEKAFTITHDDQTTVCLNGSSIKSQFTVNNATTLGAKGNYGDSIQTSLNLNGNKLAYTVLPLFEGYGSTVVYYMHAHNALQTELVFLQQGETICFGNVGSFVLDLDNVLYSIIAGPETGYVHSIRSNCDLISADIVMDVYDMATTKVNYPNQIYRIKHYGQYDINYDEYAGAEFYIDHGLSIKTQLGDLSSTIEIAANGMTVMRAYYIARSDRYDELNRILRTKCGVSFGSANQHSTLVQWLIRFIAFHAISATTDVWDKIIATSTHPEYVVHSDTKCGIKVVNFCNTNLTNASVGGCMTTTKPTTVLAAPTLQSELKFANHWTGG
jgi:hypothetical protein